MEGIRIINPKWLLLFVVMFGVFGIANANTYCYQEQANGYTTGDGSCGLNYTGSYSWSARWSYPEALTDRLWKWDYTYASDYTSKGASGIATYDFNYIKANNTYDKALFVVLTHQAPYDFVYWQILIPKSCYQTTGISTRIYEPDSYAEFQCYNSTDWTPILNFTQYKFHEDAMLWVNLSPTYSNISINSTDVQLTDKVNVSVYWTEDYGNLSSYIFSTNVSGSWINDTPVTITGNNSWTNVTITAPAFPTTYNWRIYVNDTLNKWNVTDVQNFNVFCNNSIVNISESTLNKIYKDCNIIYGTNASLFTDISRGTFVNSTIYINANYTIFEESSFINNSKIYVNGNLTEFGYSDQFSDSNIYLNGYGSVLVTPNFINSNIYIKNNVSNGFISSFFTNSNIYTNFSSTNFTSSNFTNTKLYINANSTTFNNNWFWTSKLYEINNSLTTLWSGNTLSDTYIGSNYITQDKTITNISEVFETSIQTFNFNFNGFNPTNPLQFTFYPKNDFVYNNNTSAVWYLNEGSGTQTNDSKNSFNSVAMINTSWTSGLFRNATFFNGTNSYISFGNVLGFERTNSLSFSLWFKPNSTGVLQLLLSKANSILTGYSIYRSATGKLGFALTNNLFVNNLNLETNNTFTNTSNWYNVVITYDGSSNANNVKIYVDGVLEPTTVMANTLTASILTTSPLNIGSVNNGSYSFNGSIDNVAIWNGTVLTQTDVTKIYNYSSLDSYPNYLNRTWYNMTQGLSGQYSISQLIPTVSTDTNATYEYRWTDPISERNISFPIVIKNFQIGLNGSVSILNVTFLDELTQQDISPNMTTESIWKVTYTTGGVETFSLNTTGAFVINMTPATAVVQADVEFKYIKNGYRQRTHYFINNTLDGDTIQQLRLYTINSSDTVSTPITFTLKNYNTEILPDYYLDIQRWYVDQNGYSTISLSKADVEAKMVVWLQPYLAFYRMLVYDRTGTLVYTASRQVISQSEIEIQLSSSLPSNTFDKFRTMQYTYSENKTTGLVRTDLVDTSGAQFNANMVIKRLGMFGGETVCNSTGSGSATTLSCNVPTNTSDEYAIRVDVTKADTTFPLITESLNYKTAEYGLDGVVSAFLIIGTLAFMGLGSPHMAILTTILGIGISVALGLLVTGVASFIGLIVVGIAMLMVMRK